MNLIFSMRHFGVEEGLLHRRITQAVEDRQGFLWLATPAGVQRFDGYTFTNWTSSNGLTTNAVSVIWPDADGMLWLVSKSHYSEGRVSSIDILDPHTGTVRTFKDYFGDRAPCKVEELADKAITLKDGTLLLSASGRLIAYRSMEQGSTSLPVLTDAVLRPFARVNDGSVWCVRFLPSIEFLELVRVDTTGAVSIVAGGPFRLGSVGRVEGCDLKGGDVGLHFIGEVTTGGVHEFKLTPDGTMQQLPGQLDHTEVFQWTGALYLDLGDGNWLVDASVRLVPPGGAPRQSPVLFDSEPVHRELSAGLHHTMRGRSGHIWICSEFGLWQLDMRPSHFQRLLQREDTTGGPWRSFRGLVVQGDTLFAASEQDGWYAVHLPTGATRRLDDGTWSLRYLLADDGTGGLWAGRSRELLHRRSGRVPMKALELDRVPLCALQVHDRLLLGTTLGLAWSDTALTRYERFDPAVQGRMTTATIAQLYRDRSGTIWVCSSKGLGEMDPNGSIRSIRWHGDQAHPLPAEDFRHIHEDSAGIFWVSTATHGLLRWDRSTNEVRTITQGDGLPSNSIYAVYPDKRGLLWMPTDNGIAQFDPNTGLIRSFTTRDGIAHSEFNRWSHTQGPDGRLYFGGLNGITAFHPDDLVHIPRPERAPLVINTLNQFDGDEERLVDRTAEVVRSGAITMGPLDRFFTLHVALLSFEEAGAVLYGWRVDGVDVGWNQQRETSIRFASLPFGTHLLRIRAKGGSGEWTPELVLTVHVLRPWYWRWWAIALYVLAITAGIYALFRYRLDKVRAMVAMRDRIALDLHDEVGGTLSSVALFSTVMRNRKGERPDEEKAMLERIAENSALAMEGMNDIVWSVNTRYERIADVEDRMLAYAGPIAEAKGWELAIEVEQGIRDMRLTMVERKNLYLIFKEAVNNAAKYAQCDRVEVRMVRAEHGVELTVRDNGVGLTSANGNGLGGNGLRGMHQRAAELKGELNIATHAEGGILITLRFVPHGE